MRWDNRRRLASRTAVVAAAALLLTFGGSGAAESRPGDDPEAADRVEAAVRNGDLAALSACLEEGLEVNQMLGDAGFPESLLGLALRARKLDVARFLLEQGAAVDLAPERPRTHVVLGERVVQLHTPLMVAARFNDLEGADLLLRNGADACAEGSGKVTALMVAAACRAPAVARALIDAGAAIDAQAEDVAVILRLKSIENPNAFALRPFENLGCAKGASALWLAVHESNADIVELLVKAGADPELQVDCSGLPEAGGQELFCTPRQLAEIRGNPALVQAIDRQLEARGPELGSPAAPAPGPGPR